MAEVIYLDAGSQNQIVIRQVAVGQQHPAIPGVDTRHLRHQHIDIFLPAEEHAQGRSDLVARKKSGSHLVQHWPEQMIVPFIHQGDLHGSLS
jgi:hypothetical protein